MLQYDQLLRFQQLVHQKQKPLQIFTPIIKQTRTLFISNRKRPPVHPFILGIPKVSIQINLLIYKQRLFWISLKQHSPILAVNGFYMKLYLMGTTFFVVIFELFIPFRQNQRRDFDMNKKCSQIQAGPINLHLELINTRICFAMVHWLRGSVFEFTASFLQFTTFFPFVNLYDATILPYKSGFSQFLNNQQMKSLRSFIANQDTLDTQYQGYRSYALDPLISIRETVPQHILEAKAKEIFQWAKKKGALYYTFLAFPETEGILEKQQTFLDLEYFYQETLSNSGKSTFSFQQLGKGEGDGSSFPSGGLRVTHKARAYTVWDPRSEVFLRNRTKVLYIPSLLVTHYGEALDDKTLFRKAEKVLEVQGLQLLKRLGIKASAFVMALGLEQQFFVFKKNAFDKRIDLRNTGRALIGKVPPKHQQFSDHYYGKIPKIVEEAFKDVENELLQIGVPCKTRHKEVAANQFQFCPLFEDAGKSIDHNMMVMEILKQRFAEYGLVAHFHEKPFIKHNGSGKHCNYSINYVGEDGFLYNLFGNPKKEEGRELFRLFILIQLLAVQRHSRLYLSAVGVCGNELRLGGHEAPPRIISVFLGDSVSSIVDGTPLKNRGNLKDELPNLTYDLLQEDTDRNRTSPFAYTGNKFEFRAVGSSQNVCFPMAVIAASVTDAISQVIKRLDSGKSVQEIINELLEETRPIRFNGNGYSKEWVEEARKRGLYVNDKFYENVENIKTAGQVFIDTGIGKQAEVDAKYENMKSLYKNTVVAQKDTVLHILGSQIIPRCYQHLQLANGNSSSSIINQYSEEFVQAFEKVIERQRLLSKWDKTQELADLSELRHEVQVSCDIANKVLDYIPKRDSWPEFEDFIHIYD